MHFAKTLTSSLYSEWSSKYIRYSDLKKDIKKRMAANGGRWTDEDEDDFVEKLRQELDKVYDFQRQKVSRFAVRVARHRVIVLTEPIRTVTAPTLSRCKN